jgi:DNA-binding transcriptional regulator WhiA
MYIYAVCPKQADIRQISKVLDAFLAHYNILYQNYQLVAFLENSEEISLFICLERMRT